VREAILSPDTLYCGTELGLYVTVDRGRHWVRMNGKSLPPIPVDDILIQPRERDLVVATHGRSIYILDDVTPIARLNPETRAKTMSLFDILPAQPRLYAGRGYGGGAGVFRAANPAMGARITYWLRDANPDGVKIAIADSHGTVIREISGTGRPGLNRVVWDLQVDPKHRIPSVDSQRLDQTQFVPEGEYKVTATLGGGAPGAAPVKDEKTVRVSKAPNAPTVH